MAKTSSQIPIFLRSAIETWFCRRVSILVVCIILFLVFNFLYLQGILFIVFICLYFELVAYGDRDNRLVNVSQYPALVIHRYSTKYIFVIYVCMYVPPFTQHVMNLCVCTTLYVACNVLPYTQHVMNVCVCTTLDVACNYILVVLV